MPATHILLGGGKGCAMLNKLYSPQDGDNCQDGPQQVKQAFSLLGEVQVGDVSMVERWLLLPPFGHILHKPHLHPTNHRRLVPSGDCCEVSKRKRCFALTWSCMDMMGLFLLVLMCRTW